MEYPFTIKVSDSSFEDYRIYVIVVMGWLVVMGAIGMGLAIRQRVVYRSYRELVEEESR